MKGTSPLPYSIFLLPFLIALLLSSCEDCYQCGIDQPEPFFSVKFINEDSLNTINDSIDQFDRRRIELEDSLELNEIKLEEKTDSVLIAEDEMKLIALRDTILKLEPRIDTLESRIDAVKVKKASYNKAMKTILEGRITLNSITSGIDSILNYRNDTLKHNLSIYQFPLDMNSNSSRYVINIKGLKDSLKVLEVAYRTRQVTENGSVVIKADSFSVIKNETFYEDFKRDSIPDDKNNEYQPTDETVLYLFF